MRLNLVIELRDVPGQLVSVLEPLGSSGANIVTVIHEREREAGPMVPVQLTIEGDPDTLDVAIEKLRERGIKIIEMDGAPIKEKFTSILIGDIVEGDLKETVDAINSIEGASVSDLSLKMSHERGKSSVKVTIEADHGTKYGVLERVQAIGREKNLIVVSEV